MYLPNLFAIDRMWHKATADYKIKISEFLVYIEEVV